MKALMWLDVSCLKCVLAVRMFCVEWFSWTVRGMERGLIVFYVVPFPLAQVAQHRMMTWQAGLICLAQLSIALFMWLQHGISDEKRARRLFDPGMIGGRLTVVFVAVWTVAVVLFLPPVRWEDVLVCVPMISYSIFQLSLCLPTGGKRGRKRKLAKEKLKELLGGRMPLPAGAGA
jgi:hypothetical protein